MHILKSTDDFWNIRGSFKVGGLIDIGTHASLVRLASGRFVLLDSLTLSDDVLADIREQTDAGQKIEAILNLHPFHTIHVKAMHEAFPNARLYGTGRHHERFADLPWEAEHTESEELHALFADDLQFSVPRGVDFVPSNPNLHFSSVLAFHRASGTMHVDDTLMYMRLPGPLRHIGSGDRLSFHPTLARTLEKRAGAAGEFRDWATDLINSWGDAGKLCAAHTHSLLRPDSKRSLKQRMTEALKRVEKVLVRHERQHG